MKLTHGNLLSAPAEALVNTVNTMGIMGRGIALQFKQAYPAMFRDYERACKAGEMKLGKVQVFDLGGLVGGPRWIINFPTKGHWRANSRMCGHRGGVEGFGGDDSETAHPFDCDSSVGMWEWRIGLE